jgi:hypothetical protein
MIKLRNELPSLSSGSYDKPFVQGQLYGYRRTLGNEQTLVLINYGTQAATARVTELRSSAVIKAVYPHSRKRNILAIKGAFKTIVPAQSVQIYTVGR